MRKKQEVTHTELDIGDDILVSTTNLKGIVTSCNRAFIDIAGFSEAELVGTQHNIVRHPDVPPSAFQDMWNTLKSDRPWTGIVKNRAKNGDHYWVRANVTPLRDRGRKVGYMSVRTAPSKSEVSEAELAYDAINSGKAKYPPSYSGGFMQRLTSLSVGVHLALLVVTCFLFTLINIGVVVGAGAGVLLGTTMLLSLVGTLSYGAWLAKHFTKPLHTAIEALHQMAEGRYTQWVTTDRTDELGVLLQNIFSTQIRLGYDVDEAEKQLAETMRIRQALDAVHTSVMVVSESGNIIYVNDALVKMMKSAESDLQEQLPNFKVSELVGGSLDIFEQDSIDSLVALNEIDKPQCIEVIIGRRTFKLSTNPILDNQDRHMGVVIEWADRTEELLNIQEEQARLEKERELAAENVRVRKALDSVTGRVMIADGNYDIVYLNESVFTMMREAEADIRKELANFNASELMGKNIDVFHKDPAHQRAMLNQLTSTYQGEFGIGGRTMRVVATPITDEQTGERIGTVVEWLDRTEEVKIENEVSTMVKNALNGNLSTRIALEDKNGFFRGLSEEINGLVEVSDKVISEVAEALGALAKGRLERRIEGEYHGVFGQLKDDVNNTIDRVGEIVQDTSESLSAIAKGDLTETIDGNYEGVYEQLKQGVNSTISKLTDIICRITQTSSEVLQGVQEISEGNNYLAERTDTQAANLEQTAASMEQMTTIVQNNADNTKRADRLSEEARDFARKGENAVQSVASAMGAISSSSKKIADITGVIDELAFQTNLLALNAAVEAARAGEQGRGFAVVASEVRNLASRSATAAKEIKDLIEDSVGKVGEGSTLVDESGKTLSEIMQSINHVSEIIAEISAASQEQSLGIGQVNKAVSQMDEMTQQNASLVEEASAASKSIRDQANSLTELVGYFRTNVCPPDTLSLAHNSSVAVDRSQNQSVAHSVEPARFAASAPKDDNWNEF